MQIAAFMASPTGRAIRVVLGLVLIWLGFWQMDGTAGTIVGVIGFVPLLAGAMNWCLIAPILGAPFKGSDLT